MINSIEQQVKGLNKKQFFALSFDNDTGKVFYKTSKKSEEYTLLGDILFLENQVVSSSENPFEMFSELDIKYHCCPVNLSH